MTARYRSLIPTLAAALIAAASSGQSTEATLPESAKLDGCDVIARVNGDAVLACELLWRANLIIEDRLAGIPPEAAAAVTPEELDLGRQMIVRSMLPGAIDFKLMYGDFKRKSPGASPAGLKAIHTQLAPQFDEKEVPFLLEVTGSTDLQSLDERLHALGTSIRERREAFYEQQIAHGWVMQVAQVDDEVTHDQMLQHYRENREDYYLRAEARWEELMVNCPREADRETERAAYAKLCEIGNRAFTFQQQAEEGEPAFAEIAKAESDGYNASAGGLHDWTGTDALASKAVNDALFTVPVGQMSPILRSEFGFHIVRVVERKEEGYRPFTEVQAEIRETIKQERQKTAFNEAVEQIRQGARVWTVFTGDVPLDQLASELKGPVR